MKSNRLEAFSDGVIAIIITIMVLELKVPHEPTLASLGELTPIFLSYLLSYVMVAVYWVNHHHLIHLVKKVDGHTLWTNMNMLFWMSLIPWVTRYIGENHAKRIPVTLYCVDAFLCSVSFYLLRKSIARHNDDDDEVYTDVHDKMEGKNRKAIVLYLASIVAAFIWVPAALILVALPAFMYFMPERRVERIKKTAKT